MKKLIVICLALCLTLTACGHRHTEAAWNCDPMEHWYVCEDCGERIAEAHKTDEDGYMTWNAENWTSVDGKRFICSYALDARVLSDYCAYNKYDMKGYFLPETAKEVTLN